MNNIIKNDLQIVDHYTEGKLSIINRKAIQGYRLSFNKRVLR